MQSSKIFLGKASISTATATCLFRVFAIVLAGLIFASLIDVADFGTTFAIFLSISGILRGTAATIGADDFWAQDLNRWDETALLVLLGMLVY